jgi:GTP-binding protein
MVEWCLQSSIPLHLLLTKADKLNKGAAKNELLKMQQTFSEHRDLVSMQLFSATKNAGVNELVERLDQWYQRS